MQSMVIIMADIDHAFAAKLVKQAQQGNSDAFAELYTMTYQAQYAKARRYLRDDFLAQDALQEVYILALRNLDRLDQPKAFSAWLGQINFRVCYNMSLKRKQERSIDEMEETEPLVSSEETPEESAIRTSESQYLVQAVAELPELDRRIMELRYGQNRKLSEISEMVGVSLSSVKRHIQNACAALEKTLERR